MRIVKRIVSFVTDGVLSGIIVCIGCSVFINADSKALGAILFSFGLFVILNFRLGLYTGKAAYLYDNGLKYVVEVLVTLVGNFIGTVIGGRLFHLTRFKAVLQEKAAEALDAKFNDAYISTFILAVFCGLMMYIAIEANKRCMADKNHISGIFAVVMPVMIFVYCGFNHCVADMAYFSFSGFSSMEKALKYFPIVIVGNAVGGVLLPIAKRWSMDK